MLPYNSADMIAAFYFIREIKFIYNLSIVVHAFRMGVLT